MGQRFFFEKVECGSVVMRDLEIGAEHMEESVQETPFT